MCSIIPMDKIVSKYKGKRLGDRLKLSFEYFPPKSKTMERRLWRTVGQLELLNPTFFTVTYRSTDEDRQLSLDTIAAVAKESKIPTAGHLTCAGEPREAVNKVAQFFSDNGIKRIVALRGDARDGATPANEYEGAVDLVQGLLKIDDFDISVAAYPETHPLALSETADIEYLKRKLDAGASRAITQFFFDPEVFLRFRDRAVKAGINKPIVPGILPIHDIDRVQAFGSRCGASIPVKLAQRFSSLKDDPHGQYHLSVEQGALMCEQLIQEGVDAFHFYTLNQTDLSFAVCRQLGTRVEYMPKPPELRSQLQLVTGRSSFGAG